MDASDVTDDPEVDETAETDETDPEETPVHEFPVEETLEDTAADPALEGAAAPRRASSPVERPDTDGAPMIEEASASTEDPDHPEAFGRWLRSQRELRGIHLRAIAESSKIGLGHLKALESGRFDLLPAEVFTKGFLRQYAGYVGLDPEETINFYLAAREHVEEEEDPLHVTPPPKDSSAGRWVLVALLLAAVLLGVIWGLSRLSESSDEAGAAPSGSTPPAVGDATNVEPEAGSSDTGLPGADTADSTADSVDGTPADGSAPAPTPAPASTTQPAQAAGATAPAQSQQPADVPLRIVLDFSDTCWVSALVDGGETREKVHAQGESLTLDAQSSVELKVGNYRAVEVEVNGMPYDLGSRGRSGSVVRTVLIDLDTVRSLRGAAAPTTG